jgi:hypothetical protein
MSETLSLDKSISEMDIAYWKGSQAINDALYKSIQEGKTEPVAMCLTTPDGEIITQYDTTLKRRAVPIKDLCDEEACCQIGIGNYNFILLTEEELLYIDDKAQKGLETKRDMASKKVEERLINYPKYALEALFDLASKEPKETSKDYFRSSDVVKEASLEKELIAGAVLKISSYKPGEEPTPEVLYELGLKLDLLDPKVANGYGLEPIEVASIYDSGDPSVFDFSNDPLIASAWLLEDPEIYDYLISLREKKPIEFEILKKKFKDIGISGTALKDFLNLKAAKPEKQEVLIEETAIIKDRAEQIIKRDEGFKFCVDSWNKSHHGDRSAGELLFVQRGVSCGTNSKGIHIGLRGKSAAGKSDAAINYTMRQPKALAFDANVSPRALFYAAKGLPAGTVINLDDILWNEGLESIFKQSTTTYQQGAVLLTVVDGKPLKLTLPPRLNYVMSAVDDQTSEQTRDRIVSVDIESTPKRVEQIKGYMGAKAEKPYIQVDDQEIGICRAIIADLARHVWEIVIPFGSQIELEGETRAMAVFLDIVRGVCAWHYTKREQIETEYGVVLMATEEDFYEAKRIYEAVRGHSSEKLTDKEITILEVISNHGVKGFIGGEAVKVQDMGGIQTHGNMAHSVVYNTLHGRPLSGGQRGYGLLAKIPELKYHDSKEQIRIELPGGEKWSDSKKKLYTLPDGFATSGFHEVSRELVHLREK